MDLENLAPANLQVCHVLQIKSIDHFKIYSSANWPSKCITALLTLLGKWITQVIVLLIVCNDILANTQCILSLVHLSRSGPHSELQ